MFFHLRELEHHAIEFDVTYAPGEIALGDDLRQTVPLHVAGKAELLRNTLGEIRMQGRLATTLAAPCDRCVEEARFEVSGPFDLFYRPVPRSGTHHPETRIEEGEEELAFYEGDGIQLEEVVREFVLLQVPMHLLCQPDCKGLCPVCGQNRNQAPCRCHAPKADDRWVGLGNVN